MDGLMNFNYSRSDTSHINLKAQYSGFISRLIAFSIDTVFISIVVLIATWFIGSLMDMLQVAPILEFISEQFPQVDSLINTKINPLIKPISAGFIIFLFTIFYHVLLWFFTGQTIGKALMGLRIVPLGGGRIPLWRAFLRYFSYYLSGLMLGIGFFWIIFDNRRMGWHDKLARTCVLYTWEARPDERFLDYATKVLKSRRQAINNIKSQETQLKEIISTDGTVPQDDPSKERAQDG
jgi:uncharacterized RDD family membrane protein YckC